MLYEITFSPTSGTRHVTDCLVAAFPEAAYDPLIRCLPRTDPAAYCSSIRSYAACLTQIAAPSSST